MDIKILEPFQLFTNDECVEIIDRAKSKGLRPGAVFKGVNTDVRNNKVAWLEFDENRYYDIFKQFPEYNIDWLSHPYQVSCYGKDEFYDWHTDSYTTRRSSQRMLTLTCCLQPATDAVLRIENKSYDLTSGEAIIFPSSAKHRADPPSSGERWALTIWAMQKINKS